MLRLCTITACSVDAYQSAGLAVLQVHQRVFQSGRVARIVLLTLPSVDERRRELVSVVGDVAAAAPLPVAAAAAAAAGRCRLRGGLPGPAHLSAGGRSSTSTAATRRYTTVAACPTDLVHDSGRQRRVDERRLSAACFIHCSHVDRQTPGDKFFLIGSLKNLRLITKFRREKKSARARIPRIYA